MTKQILTVYTGGTIGSAPDGTQRKLAPALAKRAIAANFAQSSSPYADLSSSLFCDSEFPNEQQTLSENMTIDKLNKIIFHIKSFDFKKFAGIIVLHGTDTLAYTAALFSMLFCDTQIPIMLVSGDRPPMDEKSNANANFRAAVELIMEGIAPNVYIPYRNKDEIIRLYLASSIMQSANFTDDFFSASSEQLFVVEAEGENDALMQKSTALSKKRNPPATQVLQRFTRLSDAALLLFPFPGLDYARISLDNIKAVLHGTYHSGTVCVERNQPEENYSSRSVLYLADACKKRGIPLFLAPSKLGKEQYSSVYDVAYNGSAIALNMTLEAAYGKLLMGASLGLAGEELVDFMQQEINNEFHV